MDTHKYFKRKYPKYYPSYSIVFDKQLEEIRRNKMKPAILKKDFKPIHADFSYKKGTIFFFNRIKEYIDDRWSGCFRVIGLFKCKEGFTQSGFHSVEMFDKHCFTEVY